MPLNYCKNKTINKINSGHRLNYCTFQVLQANLKLEELTSEHAQLGLPYLVVMLENAIQSAFMFHITEL